MRSPSEMVTKADSAEKSNNHPQAMKVTDDDSCQAPLQVNLEDHRITDSLTKERPPDLQM